MGDEDSQKKEKLLSEIVAARREASRIRKEGQNIVESTHHTIEVANAAEIFINAFPENKYAPSDQWDRQTRSWNSLGRSLSGVSYTTQIATFATDSTSATMTYFAFEKDSIERLPSPAKEAAQKGAVQLRNVLERRPLLKDVLSHMQRLALDKTHPNDRSAIALIQEAVSSAQRPVGAEPSPISVLLSIRGAIERVLADLVGRRPTQEPCRRYSDKVRSILTQCGKDKLPSQVVNELEDNVGLLHDKLSGGKGKDFLSSEISEMLIQSELFLKTFLECIDEKKLRK